MKIFKKSRRKFVYIKIIKFIIVLFLLLFFLLEFLIIYKNKIINKWPQKLTMDKITLVTAFYKIKSKHSYQDYLEWMNNILKINRSIVFYFENSLPKKIKNMRPREFENKTIWIEYNMKDFYSFNHYLKDFKETYTIDIEKSHHSVPLYLIWAEKCKFLENAVNKNYFNSTCFYWVDAGFFRNSTKIKSYINDWPSPKNCFEDPRVIFNVLRASSKNEIEELRDFNINTHLEFQKQYNVGGNMFGGQSEYIKKFKNLYYNTLELFIKKKIFIGKDQNIFAYISYLHPETIKLVYSGNWFYLQDYLS
jgi:hypothetical protein